MEVPSKSLLDFVVVPDCVVLATTAGPCWAGHSASEPVDIGEQNATGVIGIVFVN